MKPATYAAFLSAWSGQVAIATRRFLAGLDGPTERDREILDLIATHEQHLEYWTADITRRLEALRDDFEQDNPDHEALVALLDQRAAFLGEET